VAFLSRELALEKTLLGFVRELRLLDRSLLQNQREIRAAVDELATVDALGTYSEDSASYKELEIGIDRLERNRERLERTRDARWEDFEAFVGMSVEDLPEALPEPALELPPDPDPSWNSDVYLADIDERFARLELEDVQADFIPRLSVSGSYGLSIKDNFSAVENHVISAGFSGGFEDFSIFGSLSGNLSGKTVSAAFGFSWSQPDDRAEGLTVQIEENDLTVAGLKLEAARESFDASLEDLETRLLDLEDRSLRQEETRMITELKLQEAEARFELGIINEDALEAARWAVDSLVYDEFTLAVDKLLAECDIQGLFLLR